MTVWMFSSQWSIEENQYGDHWEWISRLAWLYFTTAEHHCQSEQKGMEASVTAECVCVLVCVCACVCMCLYIRSRALGGDMWGWGPERNRGKSEKWATTRQEREVSHMAGMRGSGLSSLFPQERERGRERGRHTNASYALNRPDSFTAPRNPLTPSSVDPWEVEKFSFSLFSPLCCETRAPLERHY